MRADKGVSRDIKSIATRRGEREGERTGGGGR